MTDFDTDDCNQAAARSVAAWELAREAVGRLAARSQLERGARSALVYCPRCGQSNCLMACCCNGFAIPSHYECLKCGKIVEAEEL